MVVRESMPLFSKITKRCDYFVSRTSGIIPFKTPFVWIRNLRTHRIITPGKVSHKRSVPSSIVKPEYAINATYTRPSAIEIKNSEQIHHLRKAGSLARKVLNTAAKVIQAGITTDEIDRIVHEVCIENDCYPSPLMYRGFPKSCCTSVNNVMIHGIPDDTKLENGDIINVDVTVYHNGYHGDCSETFIVGESDDKGRDLVSVAKICRDVGIKACRPGAELSDIGKAISAYADEHGFEIVQNIIGHGIGSYFHGPPDIIHVDHYDDTLMEPGMVFTIEPCVVEGSPEYEVLPDGWTTISKDGCRSAQFEHTVLVTESGVQILTDG